MHHFVVLMTETGVGAGRSVSVFLHEGGGGVETNKAGARAEGRIVGEQNKLKPPWGREEHSRGIFSSIK